MPNGDIYIGLMSGTSMDAIDTALASFSNESIPQIIAYEQFPIDNSVKSRIRDIDANSNLAEVTKADVIMGNLFAESVQKILELSDFAPSDVKALGCHGQTILHLPDDELPRTLQIGDPNIIASRTNITTVADFRRMDIAAGGQGAPLAPGFHKSVFSEPEISRVILNIGGIANTTLLPAEHEKKVSGFDTGPGNGLLDDWNQLHQGTEMDRDSSWARTGKVAPQLLSTLLNDRYFELPPPKSSGRDYFNMTWLNQHLKTYSSLKPEDVQATLLALTVESIAFAIERFANSATEIYVCGGGAHNTALMADLTKRLPNKRVANTRTLGIDPDAVEALTFAWLAKQTIERKTGNLTAVTGANSAQILGGIYQAR